MKKLQKPRFLIEREEAHKAEVASVDINKLPKPTNTAETSGPKKMKDFGNWQPWKTLAVGLAGLVVIIILWFIYGATTPDGFLSNPQEVWKAFVRAAFETGVLWKHMGYSFSRVLIGYAIAIVASIPLAFLMAWYRPVRAVVDPIIQFLRCIPPIAYVPLIVFGMGVGEGPKYVIIFIACFLTMTVTIYQGVKNVDLTLVKAAYTFGAKDKNLFLDVIVPSSFPFILTAMRLGVGAALTTLVAAELTGTTYGLGAMIQSQASNLNFGVAIMGIIILGVFGIILDKILLFAEKKLTKWK